MLDKIIANDRKWSVWGQRAMLDNGGIHALRKGAV